MTDLPEMRIIKESRTPVYRQIIEQIMLAIKQGSLATGDQLPPERELAKRLGTSRGTVTKAYESLVRNNVLENRQGKGTFVSQGQNVHGIGRKEQAVTKIKQLLVDLEKLRFTHREIGTLFHLLLMEREQMVENTSIAAIDCNPEALAVFEEQLRHISNVQIVKFLLKEVLNDADSLEQLREYDLILATSTHYNELVGHLPELADKIVQAAVSPSQQTIIDLATIPAKPELAIVCRSHEFRQIILNKLADFKITEERVASCFETDDLDLDALLQGRNVLLLPPDSPLLNKSEYLQSIRRFRERGGQLIEFTYQIERGTLIHIEEKISNLLEQA